ncbi:NUDIX hydrolase [Roseivirga echinicomitans]
MRFSNIETVANELRFRLGLPLPGRDAQIRMAPIPVDESRFNEMVNRPAKPGGVMVLLYPKNGELYLPLMKRPGYIGAHGGQVSFPGGKSEKHDLNLVDTALRETEEEIGVKSTEISVLGQLSELFITASNFKVSPTVGIIDHAPLFIPDPYEVEAVLEVPISQFYNLEKRGVEEMRFGKYVIHSPYFNVDGHLVWGATAMMLSELLAVMDDIGEGIMRP